MESREQLISRGLSFLGKSEFRRGVYRRINGHRTANDIAKELKRSVNQVLNEIKYLHSAGLIRLKKKVGRNKIYEKDPKYVSLRLEDRKRFVRLAKPAKVPIKVAKLEPKIRRLLKFKGKYPEVFYDRLEDEINLAYSNPKLPNAALMLARKLIENLAYNLLEYKFGPQNIHLYYNTAHRRAHDFGILLDNLKTQKNAFPPDEQDLINKFLQLVQPFRRDANVKVHKVIEYLENMREIRKFKIEEMTQLLLKLIEKVRQTR